MEIFRTAERRHASKLLANVLDTVWLTGWMTAMTAVTFSNNTEQRSARGMLAETPGEDPLTNPSWTSGDLTAGPSVVLQPESEPSA
ncbi:hypothetical protein V1264_012662 [Littorina saxatilis]|uniref:Uncharacterized protein n=1 Tax=Littorina saxatilis TaxID=31220 RepID=A0AAN9BWZ7_9CAEN